MDAVEYTISQDVGKGQEAKRDEDLQAHHQNLPAASTIPSSRNAKSGALADYQIQLMLLEQQNKRRLLLARQEQDAVAFGNSSGYSQGSLLDVSFSSRKDNQVMATKNLKNDNTEGEIAVSENSMDYGKSLSTGATSSLHKKHNKHSPKPLLTGDATPQQEDHTSTHSAPEMLPVIATERQATCVEVASKPQSVLEVFNDELAHDRSLDTGSPEVQRFTKTVPAGPCGTCHLLLYRIICDGDAVDDVHDGEYFFDEPQMEHHEYSKRTDTRHWLAQDPVLDFQEDLLSLEATYATVKTVKCGPASRSKTTYLENPRQDLIIHSPELREAIFSVATYPFDERQPAKRSHGMKGPPLPEELRQASPERSGTGNTASDSRLAQMFQEYTVSDSDTFFYHHWQALSDLCEQREWAASHLRCIMSHVCHLHEAEWNQYANDLALGKMRASGLKKLFRVNEPVVATRFGKDAAYILRHPPTQLENRTSLLMCWYWSPTTTHIQRVRQTLVLRLPWNEEFSIPDMEVIPSQYASRQVLDDLESRGRRYWHMLSQHRGAHFNYHGWNVQQDDYLNYVRVIVDYATYKKFHAYASPFREEAPQPRRFDRHRSAIGTDTEPESSDLILFPPDIYAYNLISKQWLQLFVDNMTPIRWNFKAFDRLVLPSRTKELVKALVTVRTTKATELRELGSAGGGDDIVAGKGTGLIMLLHGGPGTGKTLTAESVAEIAKMPLYRVTCGDVGTSPEQVERYLGNALYLGKRWNCVLLIDEADVFLEERSLSDLTRNSLVAVFLRILEYYDGIMVLTSNRVGTFDEAFKSRIQVALHYDDLSRASRRKVWSNLLEMLEENDDDPNFSEIRDHLDDLSELQLNGRVIRNALTTARQLALYKDQRLGWKHIDQAVNVSLDFDTYLTKVHGHSDAQYQRDGGVR